MVIFSERNQCIKSDLCRAKGTQDIFKGVDLCIFSSIFNLWSDDRKINRAIYSTREPVYQVWCLSRKWFSGYWMDKICQFFFQHMPFGQACILIRLAQTNTYMPSNLLINFISCLFPPKEIYFSTSLATIHLLFSISLLIVNDRK